MSKLIFLELTTHTHTQDLAYAPDPTIPGAYVSALVVLVLILQSSAPSWGLRLVSVLHNPATHPTTNPPTHQ